ncbi:MAG: hypothetical protein M1319_02235 [Chloroflexi bacterium]|nr:hypothetical protein [Chloroflexota bacterium]
MATTAVRKGKHQAAEGNLKHRDWAANLMIVGAAVVVVAAGAYVAQMAGVPVLGTLQDFGSMVVGGAQNFASMVLSGVQNFVSMVVTALQNLGGLIGEEAGEAGQFLGNLNPFK